MGYKSSVSRPQSKKSPSPEPVRDKPKVHPMLQGTVVGEIIEDILDTIRSQNQELDYLSNTIAPFCDQSPRTTPVEEDRQEHSVPMLEELLNIREQLLKVVGKITELKESCTGSRLS